MTTLAYPVVPFPTADQRRHVATEAIVSAYVHELMRPVRRRDTALARRPACEAARGRRTERASRRLAVR